MDVKGRRRVMMSIDEDDEMELRRGPWNVDEDLTLINYIATHGEGRWNTLALSAGLKRTGKSCRLRWLNYLRPDVRRGNITLDEQLLILELHTRWGNRWSKIAQYLPGRTDNEIKNYWRTRVQKLAKQLKCDVNSKQFKDTMRYLWMPRLVERIQAAAAPNAAATTTSTSTLYTSPNNNEKIGLTPIVMKNEFVGSQSHVTQCYNTPEISSTGASSDQADYYNNNNPNSLDYYQPSDCITSQSGFFHHELDFQHVEQNTPLMQIGDSCETFWNDENMLFLQQQLMNDL